MSPSSKRHGITLITTDAESRFDSGTFEEPLEELRAAVWHLAEKIAARSDKPSGQIPQPSSEPTPDPASELTFEEEAFAPHHSGCHVLVMSHKGEEMVPESVPVDDQNPVVVCITRKISHTTVGPLERAMDSPSNVIRAIGHFCHYDNWSRHLVVIMDADFYFYPGREWGTFTQKLDNDKKLMEWIDTIGESLAGYEGDLVLVAALLQDSQRLKNFVRMHGWSWVWHHDGHFEVMYGHVPEVLEDCYYVEREPVLETKPIADSIIHSENAASGEVPVVGTITVKEGHKSFQLVGDGIGPFVVPLEFRNLFGAFLPKLLSGVPGEPVEWHVLHHAFQEKPDNQNLASNSLRKAKLTLNKQMKKWGRPPKDDDWILPKPGTGYYLNPSCNWQIDEALRKTLTRRPSGWSHWIDPAKMAENTRDKDDTLPT